MSNVRMSRRPRLRALGKTSGSVSSIRWFAGKRLAANRNKPSNGPSARLTVARRPGRDGRRYIAQLIEFGLVVISPDDFLILAHRPVSSSTFFAVKFSNLCFYILLLGTSLNVIPALVGLGSHGSRWYFPLVYLAVSTVASLFVAGFIVVLYGLVLRRVNYEKFKDLLVYVQIGFSFLFFFGYQIVPGVADSVGRMDITVLAHS